MLPSRISNIGTIFTPRSLPRKFSLPSIHGDSEESNDESKSYEDSRDQSGTETISYTQEIPE